MKTKILITSGVIIMTWLLAANQTIKAQTCGSSIVLDIYECVWREDLKKCEVQLVEFGPYAYDCRSSPCETIDAVCSSNDIDKCIGDTPQTCHFYPTCSRSPCYEYGSGEACGGTSSCSSKSCSGNATCRSSEGECKCITVPSAPTPTPQIQATIQGRKARDPGLVTGDPSLIGIPVTLNDPAGTSTADPFVFDYLTIDGGMRTVSVPAVPPVGYHLLGYSLCYNNWSCHGTVTAGNSATISDDLMLTQNYVPGNVPYADLYWHYCQPPQAIAAPVTVTATGCNQVTVSWGAVADATSYNVYRWVGGAAGKELVAGNVTGTSAVLSGNPEGELRRSQIL